MKEIKDLQNVSGGTVTISSTLGGDMVINCDSYLDDVQFSSALNMPQGTFSYSGYESTSGKHYGRHDGIVEIYDLDTGCTHMIEIYPQGLFSSTTFVVSTYY